jgi:hypothetical protein
VPVLMLTLVLGIVPVFFFSLFVLLVSLLPSPPLSLCAKLEPQP